jgi:hypothetical protein
MKNEVKFWDVRLELLDHIVSSVEDKINNEGLSFEEAMLQVHRGFGNQLIRGRISQHNDWTKGLYQANNGFRRFIKNKQKEIARKHRRLFWKTLPKFLVTPKFMIEFVMLLLITSFTYQFNPKAAAILACLACYLMEFSKLFLWVFNKAGKRSLRVQMSANLGMLFFSFSYVTIAGFGSYYEDVVVKPYIFLVLLFICLFPLLRHAYGLFHSVLRDNSREYKMLVS